MAKAVGLDRTQRELQEMLEARLQPGADYLKALRELGLEPEALFWAREIDTQRPVIVLITSFFDHAGPLAVSEALFKAYNAAATPADIDPFIVRLHSPRQTFARALIQALKQEIEIETDRRRRTNIEKILGTFLTSGDLQIPLNGIYKRPRQVRKTVEVGRHWRHFIDNIDRLAA